MRAAKGWWVCGFLAAGLLVAWVRAPLAADLGVWSGGSEPIQIHSESLEARADEGLVLFQGGVVARQGDLTLQADHVSAQVDREAQQIRTVEARGNVRIQREELVATALEARFDVLPGLLTLSGEAKAWRGRNVVAGERIILHLADNRMVVEGAKAVFVPQEQPARP